jgi:hypothetical protein
MSRKGSLVLFLVVVLALVGAVNGQPAQAATCADYSNQAAAQHAHDTRDADGDGIYCESLPCPCAKPGDAGSGGDPLPHPQAGSGPRGCVRPSRVQNISFSKTKYPNIRRHFLAAVRKGLAAHAGAQPLGRRRAPRSPARVLSNPLRAGSR